MTSLCLCVHLIIPLNTFSTSVHHTHTHILTMILMHIWHFEAPFVMRGRRGGAGDISCSHNVIHYGRGAPERVQRALPACATTHLSPCPLLFSLSPSLFTLGEMAGAFFPSPGGLRDIPACFGLIRQTYITYLSLSPASLSSSNFALGGERAVIFRGLLTEMQ